MGTASRATGLDISPNMIAGARATAKNLTPAYGPAVDFVCFDMSQWVQGRDQRRSFCESVKASKVVIRRHHPSSAMLFFLHNQSISS